MEINISSELVQVKETHATKFPLRRNIRTTIVYGENSLRRIFLRRNILTAKLHYGEFSHCKISYGEISGHCFYTFLRNRGNVSFNSFDIVFVGDDSSMLNFSI